MAEKKTLAEIARAAWMNAGHLEDHWQITAAAVRNAVIDECIRASCRECRRGDEPQYHADLRYRYHWTEAGDLGCTASHLHALKDGHEGRLSAEPGEVLGAGQP